MEGAAHAAAQRLVDQLVLLHAGHAGKRAGGDGGAVVIAVTGEILDLDLGIGQRRLDGAFDLGRTHRHEGLPA